jgi:hypothetical protein
MAIRLGSEPPPTWLGLLAALAAVALGTLLVYPLKSVAPVVSLGVVYLPAILLISVVGPVARAALLGRQRDRLQLLPDTAVAPVHDCGGAELGCARCVRDRGDGQQCGREPRARPGGRVREPARAG